MTIHITHTERLNCEYRSSVVPSSLPMMNRYWMVPQMPTNCWNRPMDYAVAADSTTSVAMDRLCYNYLALSRHIVCDSSGHSLRISILVLRDRTAFRHNSHRTLAPCTNVRPTYAAALLGCHRDYWHRLRLQVKKTKFNKIIHI